jgi:DNA polymerase
MDDFLKALYGKFESLRLAGVRWLPVAAAPAAASAGAGTAASGPGSRSGPAPRGPGAGGWAGVANQMKQELEKKAAGRSSPGGAGVSTANPSPGPKGPTSPKGEGLTTTAPATVPAAGGEDESLRPNRPVAAEAAGKLEAVREQVKKCVRCKLLAETRRQTAFSDGPASAEVMFIGEAPGEDEDRQGVPFVGRAGQLLNKIIAGGMRMRREDVYICNIIKCRPPENRNPLPEEAANCREYLEAQIELVRPRVICCLGGVASHFLLDDPTAVGKMRGRWLQYRGIPVRVTYHPAYLLRNYTADARQKVWDDVVAVVAKLREVREKPEAELGPRSEGKAMF